MASDRGTHWKIAFLAREEGLERVYGLAHLHAVRARESHLPEQVPYHDK